MIELDQDQQDNGVIEKYCYMDNPDSCLKYGGLYRGGEVLQYEFDTCMRGICPTGWHVPSKEEWMVLMAAADSLYNIGDYEWCGPGIDDYIGYNTATNLKTTWGWHESEYSEYGNGTDLVGFSTLPGGWVYTDQYSTRHFSNVAWGASLYFFGFGFWYNGIEFWYGNPGLNYMDHTAGGVRCIKGDMLNVLNPNIELIFTAMNNGTHVQLDSIRIESGSDAITLYWPDTTLLVPYELHYFSESLLMIGYADNYESAFYGNPEENQSYCFEFATNIPCPGTPTVEYDGQVYNTIQVFSQCWLKENLNVGAMINGTIEQSNNFTIEKYCYNNAPDSCTKYGGLYQWDEMMQYTTTSNRGICPEGWHIPTDDEWRILEGTIDSQYGVADKLLWKTHGIRGYDAGSNLKSIFGWNSNGVGADLFGFSGLPGGFKAPGSGGFADILNYGYWWTSTQEFYLKSLYRSLYFDSSGVIRQTIDRENSYSVRCLRDE
jgi:uncharacterized protein (TIGR02145 family)